MEFDTEKEAFAYWLANGGILKYSGSTGKWSVTK